MLAAAFEARSRRTSIPTAPGRSALPADRRSASARARPEAEWRDPRILYAGYLADGSQVRIGYFEGRQGPSGDRAARQMADLDPELAPGYRISPFAETEEIGART